MSSKYSHYLYKCPNNVPEKDIVNNGAHTEREKKVGRDVGLGLGFAMTHFSFSQWAL